MDVRNIVNQLLGGINVIYLAFRTLDGSLKEMPAYECPTIKHLYMCIGELQVKDREILGYFTISYKTPTTKHPVDVLDVIITLSGVRIRFLGGEIITVSNKDNTILDNRLITNWVRIAVTGNSDLMDLLKSHKEFLNAHKKNSK